MTVWVAVWDMSSDSSPPYVESMNVTFFFDLSPGFEDIWYNVEVPWPSPEVISGPPAMSRSCSFDPVP